MTFNLGRILTIATITTGLIATGYVEGYRAGKEKGREQMRDSTVKVLQLRSNNIYQFCSDPISGSEKARCIYEIDDLKDSLIDLIQKPVDKFISENPEVKY